MGNDRGQVVAGHLGDPPAIASRAEHASKVGVLAVSGSLRRDSWNRALVRAAMELAPPHLSMTEWRLDDLPSFNVDHEEPKPASVSAWLAAIVSADALLIATPEYNGSIPGLLKNALDWASRPPLFNPMRGKSVVIVGASTGSGGTRRAQADLRRVLELIGANVLAGPVIALEHVATKFVDGQLVEDGVRRAMAELVGRLGVVEPLRRSV